MKLQCFSIKDVAVGAFSQPFYARSRAEAVRMLQDTMATREHQFSKHPQDFGLYRVGEWDDQTGVFEPYSVPEHMVQLLDLAEKEP